CRIGSAPESESIVFRALSSVAGVLKRILRQAQDEERVGRYSLVSRPGRHDLDPASETMDNRKGFA
ncbi:MAG: hypothetical protein OEZ03_16320, partial [Alphaproteobacteria bacterium]|nr:hypothetical protein [Alphaproteobacteria bacterium]